MDIQPVHSEDAPKAVGPYSQAIAAGHLIFCSGQIPLDPATGALVEGDIAVQTARVLDNLAAGLAAAGSDLAHGPARSAFQVAALPRGARVEIEAVAVRI